MFNLDFDSLPDISIDDSFLQRAVSSMSKHSLLLIEDIDCAFPRRDGADDFEEDAPQRSSVTLSGLLNLIDGVNSEDGKLFFATVRLVGVYWLNLNVSST
jgi:mitochondrial chaperone BCS1